MLKQRRLVEAGRLLPTTVTTKTWKGNRPTLMFQTKNKKLMGPTYCRCAQARVTAAKME